MTDPTMFPTARRSPVQHLLEAKGVAYRSFGGSSYPVRRGTQEDDQRAFEQLGVCDLSGLQKLGLKGVPAEAWLADRGINVPGKIFATHSLPGGGIIVRFGAREFFLEDNIGNGALPDAADVDAGSSQLVRVEHQEATFMLTGCRALDALAQMCAINFHDVPSQMVVCTRVASVSCVVLPEKVRDVPAYRIWIDPSYAVYAWQTFTEICESLGGGEIGAGCIYSELLTDA